MLVNTAKYCEPIQDVIWSLTEMITKPTQPLIIILLQNIANLFKSLFDLWQKWLPNLPNPLSSFCSKMLRTYSSRYLILDRNDCQTYSTPYHHFAAKYCEPIQVVIWSLTELFSKPTQPLIVPLSNLIITLMMYIILSATQSKPHRPGWRGMHVQGGRRQGWQGGSWPPPILPE